jgi:Ca2+-binding RTX toxin-like protein
MSGDFTVISGSNDRLSGNGGRDDLHGQTGNDRLNGGGGADILNGGEGVDVLIGGRGKDSLTDRAARDTFLFKPGAGVDRVLDFTDTNGSQDDRIDVLAYGFTRIGQIGKTTAGDDPILTFEGDTARIVGDLADHTPTRSTTTS